MAQVIHSAPVGLQSEAEVLDFAGRSVGPIDQHTDISREGSPHRVALLTTRSGERLIAKWFADSPSYFRTFDALGVYAVPLGSAAPRLIDQHDGLRAILMTALPGRAVSTDQALDPVVHYRAGQLLRQFHESAPANRSIDVLPELASALSLAIDRAEHDLGPVVTAEARDLGMRVLDVGEVSLQPRHGSCRPEHWLSDPDYGLQFISFSLSEYDPWIIDTFDLERNLWRYSSELRGAFLSGYDRHPSEADTIILRAYSARRALEWWLKVSTKSSTKKARKDAWAEVEAVLGSTLF